MKAEANHVMKKLVAVIAVMLMLSVVVVSVADEWTCTNCWKKSEGNYCSWCGSKKPDIKVACHVCGAEFEAYAGYAFCNNCGAPLDTITFLSAEESGQLTYADILSETSTGAIITLGHYEQDNNPDNGPEPIEWIVLKTKQEKTLLLSKYGLENMPYTDKYEDDVWETCTLRYWLNHDFLNEAFTPEEASAILMTTVDNHATQGCEAWNRPGSNTTEDRLFLLSCAEAERFLGVTEVSVNNVDSRVVPTAVALAHSTFVYDYVSEDGVPTASWWLRSPGRKEKYMALVFSSGSLLDGFLCGKNGVVRPAFWLDMNAKVFPGT